MDQQETVDYGAKWFVMAAVAMSIFLGTIDGSIVNIAAQPTLVRVFQADLAVVQWVTLAYLLVIATLLLSIGRLADIYGKKSIFVWGIVIFTVGSVLCGLVPTIEWLIALLVLQAIGAAMITALGVAIVTASFHAQERGRALGTIGCAREHQRDIGTRPCASRRAAGDDAGDGDLDRARGHAQDLGPVARTAGAYYSSGPSGGGLTQILRFAWRV